MLLHKNVKWFKFSIMLCRVRKPQWKYAASKKHCFQKTWQIFEISLRIKKIVHFQSSSFFLLKAWKLSLYFWRGFCFFFLFFFFKGPNKVWKVSLLLFNINLWRLNWFSWKPFLRIGKSVLCELKHLNWKVSMSVLKL